MGLDRILEVARYFGIHAGVVITKHDLNKEMTDRLVSRLSTDIMSRKIKDFSLSEVGKQTKT